MKWRTAFNRSGDEYCLRQAYRTAVWFLVQDISLDFPDGRFDLVLWCNLVFTYFQVPLQAFIAKSLAEVLVPCGLPLGAHVSIPVTVAGLTQGRSWLYRRGEGRIMLSTMAGEVIWSVYEVRSVKTASCDFFPVWGMYHWQHPAKGGSRLYL